jgi:hypothetical protein
MPAAYERPEGVTDSEWKEFLAQIEKNDECLRNRVCPDCESPLTKALDFRQAGPTLVQGTWFKYRCTKTGCSFFVDQCEPD